LSVQFVWCHLLFSWIVFPILKFPSNNNWTDPYIYLSQILPKNDSDVSELIRFKIECKLKIIKLFIFDKGNGSSAFIVLKVIPTSATSYIFTLFYGFRMAYSPARITKMPVWGVILGFWTVYDLVLIWHDIIVINFEMLKIFFHIVYTFDFLCFEIHDLVY